MLWPWVLLLGCAEVRLPSVQLFVENRVSAAVAVPAGQPLRRTASRELTAGVRFGFDFERRAPP
jgi:hypothetical protein